MPQIVILAGPNGAGKSTAAAGLLSEEITFLNADDIAKGLPAIPSAARDVRAGRLLLAKLDELQSQRRDIAIETTLASRTLAPRIARLQREGCRFLLYFFWLPSPEMALQRVAKRVLSGGHDIPKPVIRRRYVAGLNNFFSLYQPLANLWRVYDNTQTREPVLIVKGTLRVQQAALWKQIREDQQDGRSSDSNEAKAD